MMSARCSAGSLKVRRLPYSFLVAQRVVPTVAQVFVSQSFRGTVHDTLVN